MPEDIQVALFIVAGTLLLLLLVSIVVVSVLFFQRARNKHQRAMHALESQLQQESLLAQLEVKEQTLHDVSQEIHDNIGQVLSLAKLHLGTLPRDGQAATHEKITHAKALVAQAIKDLRDMSHILNAGHAGQRSLAVALRQEVGRLAQTGCFAATFHLEGKERGIGAQSELIVFRMVQEALQNIIKHADASRVQARLDYGKRAVSLMVCDDGKGFDTSRLHTSLHGTGLKNVYQRAKLIGAQVAVESATGKGTTVTIAIPYKTA